MAGATANKENALACDGQSFRSPESYRVKKAKHAGRSRRPIARNSVELKREAEAELTFYVDSEL